MAESTLFPQPPTAPVVRAGGPYAQVAIERSLDRTLDYAVPANMATSLKVGQRVKVPLGRGNKPAHGYVVEIRATTAVKGTIKPIMAIEDDRVLITPPLLELARWMSRYYCAALGTVLESVIPSAVKKRVGLEYTQVVRLAAEREAVQAALEKTKAPKRRAILARLLQLEPAAGIDLLQLSGEAGVTPPTVRGLVKLGLINITPEPDFGGLGDMASVEPPGAAEQYLTLNEDQAKVFDELRTRLAGGFSVNLLHGVTGSGKTEVYLRCIREVVAAGRQAIVLVPEIALTPQTVRRFTARFGRVAVLHSGLSAGDRHRYWQMIWQGKADVVVGARSAVFAPLPKLGIIVVDEEHEPSYKQDTAPRYHGRDVAIKRGQIENVPVVLGSATPSLESWWRVAGSGGVGAASAAGEDERRAMADPTATKAAPTPSRFLLSLPRRVRGLQMPQVELVDMKQELRMRPGVHLLGLRLERLLRETIDAKHQAILLLNRRGYSNFVYCPSCQHLVQCKYCDATMTYHRSAGTHARGGTSAEGVHTGQLHCHYCLAVNKLPEKCPECGKKLSLFGLGTQRVEEELAKKFPGLVFARVDSDSMHSARDYERLLGRFASGEIQVMLGTQMIAKGLDYPNVTLVGVISGDTALALPDFRAAERTFQLITQVAGRAGRGDAAGRVVLQTFLPKDATIQAALRQDFAGFAAAELQHRRDVGHPPFGRMVRIIARDQDLPRLHERCETLAAAIHAAAQGQNITIKGPMPCAVNRVAGYHRHQIVLTSPSATALQRLLAAVRAGGGFSHSDRIAVDVDPVSLL